MLPWRRHRRSGPGLDPHDQADAWQVVSLLLDYPGTELVERLPVLRQVVSGLPPEVADRLGRFLDHVETTDLRLLQVDYVDTFDVTRKCCLHLTYFLHGDTRNRGVALVQFKQAYRKHGAELTDPDAELPDHLSVVLEFGATVDPDAGWRLLNDHRVGIELLRRALLKRSSPWLDVVDALRATLPQLAGDDEQALARLIAEGPPQETVGIGEEMEAPYAIDPALDHLRTAPPSGSTCGDAGAPAAAPHTLGLTIPVGAPR
ncbi:MULTISPECIES: nitrate reductase molybdenum cofactor assembly chaperone [unclassified Ornithinimicrobium]|uniref:nitrate reductase molybdenum cofactor assembly chaperone n=1 Tax=unclassified Ornithinimicrobium TaxID=2615080 RepID=UPI00385298BB